MVLNFNDTLTTQHNGSLVINHFLEEYQNLLRNLQSSFTERRNSKVQYSGVSFHVTRMKSFAIEKGGLRCVELLAEYEKNSSIGDCASCTDLEKSILSELNYFKEFWISMLS